jgi:hypothetical protein
MDESLASQYARADALRRRIDEGGAGGDRLPVPLLRLRLSDAFAGPTPRVHHPLRKMSYARRTPRSLLAK